jgi:3',5'-cyclic AMP phosphodiesterase CpdA
LHIDHYILSITRKARLALVCLLLLCASPLCAQHFYFAQMTDLHFGGARDNAARAAKAVDNINRLPLKLECVVVTGDLMADNILDSNVLGTALTTLKPLRLPVHYLSGNHDILEGDKTAATQAAYTKSFGPLASKAEYYGVVFLMLYTEPLKRRITIPGYDPLQWLGQALKDAGSKPVIVFTHAPDDEDFFANEMHAGWPANNRQKWEALIESHNNVKAVITGHFHRDELHWIGGVPEFVSAPTASYFGRQATYRVYEYTDGKIGYRTIYLD